MIDDLAAAVPAQPANTVAPPAPGAPGRIEWLFRETLRRRTIHPLMALIQHYRRAGAP
jgi:hypothetical protein